jgi:arylsulfatase A-like enzyme
MKTLITALAALAIGPAHSARADLPAAASHPNIIIILADDLGFGDLGCYGHPRFETPNLDRMASEGIRLTQFNTPNPFCAPTRASLLTGRYPFRCGLTTNPDPDGGPVADRTALPRSEITLAHVLREAGYATSMVGKWHLGHQRNENLPTRRGFDEYLGIPYSNDMRPVRLLDGEKEIEYPVVQATLTRRYTERALRFMERNRSRPFFLYLAHAMPHKPLEGRALFFGHQGPRLATVRDSRWKLHVLALQDTRLPRSVQPWRDARGPDGVTILAPYEQPQPTEYPWVRTGDPPRAMSLFDLENDPAEQHDVAAQHGDVVARLKAQHDEIAKEFKR